ncbi:MAG: MtrB/PioB family outer membrane beta-barrel protein [Desulfuromonas sp.]
MKKLWTIAALALLLPTGALAQDGGRIETSGQITAGVLQDNVNNSSSKFNEYRDIQSGFNLFDLKFEGIDTETGNYLEFGGQDLTRDDQSLRFGIGNYGTWGLSIDHKETPHNISNKAMSPYIYQGGGLYTVPTPVLDTPIVGMPNAATNTADVLATDAATADWLTTHLDNVGLGTQRDETSASLKYAPFEALKFRLTYSDKSKDGSKLTYGPIGNRPPNSMNIQFTEPIDYVTREVKFEAEYNRDRFQSLFSYLISDFENATDTLTWQNIWAYNPEDTFTQASSDSGSQRLATFGQRALAPDNRFQNASLTFGFNLPMASRLTATAAYGKMEQDESLIPYSTSDFDSTVTAFSSTSALPRRNAEAEIETMLVNLDYTFNPIDRLNLRAFYRFYDLDNNTTEDDWHYITSDAIPNGDADNGTPTFKNSRTNLAYAYDQQNYGLDARYNLAFWRTNLGLGFEREEVDRDYREADTDENVYKISVRTRPTNWISLRGKYRYGDRKSSSYDYDVTAASYWYDTSTQTNLDNPALTFSNHPDMRKFDVIDRERQQVDLSATVTPMQMLDLTASYRWQNDDYDDKVTAVQPLADIPQAIRDANYAAYSDWDRFTPGDQLGLLERETERYALDASYVATEHLALNAFFSRETIESKQRSMEYNENYKITPTARLNNDLGGWDERFDYSQWTAITDDRTNTVGAGLSYQMIPGKLNFLVDYSFSFGKVDIDYSGLGSVATGNPGSTLPADTDQYAFRNPSTIKHKQYNLNASMEYKLTKNLVFGLHYMFDKYNISDWSQEADTPWFESVGSEFMLRDTSDSRQWGNRLVNMGSYLGPDYEAHVGYLSMTYRF